MSSPVAILSRPDKVHTRVQELHGTIALDTEFHAEARFQPELMWIQLADEQGDCLLIDAQVEENTRAVIQALENRDLLVHAGMHDLRILAQTSKPRPRTVFDTQIAAGLLGLRYPFSLSRLVTELLAETLPSSEAMSDWSRRPIAPEQLAYACADVAFLHPLKQALESRPPKTALPPLQECCESLLEEALSESPESDLWKRFHAAPTLDARGREVLRRACILRRALAVEQNRGERQIYSDSSLIDLAKRQPTTLEELNQPRNIPRKLRGDLGRRLVDCVVEALRVPLNDCPPSLHSNPREPECRLLLEAFSEHCFRTLGISPRLLLPSPVRARLASDWAQGRPLQFRSHWRRLAAGAQLTELCAGGYRLASTGLERA